MIPGTRRETKYTKAVSRCIAQAGHATNAQIATHVRTDFPRVSDTTIHRVTQRLYDDGRIGLAPKASDGAVRYDNETIPHDHFICEDCGAIRDLRLSQLVRRDIEQSLGGCRLSGSLIIVGECKACKEA